MSPANDRVACCAGRQGQAPGDLDGALDGVVIRGFGALVFDDFTFAAPNRRRQVSRAHLVRQHFKADTQRMRGHGVEKQRGVIQGHGILAAAQVLQNMA